MDQNIRKYVVWYQGGTGGFLLAWLLQLAHDDRGAKSPSHVTEALNCFPLLLKDNAIEWKNYEITPPDVGIQCNSFYNLQGCEASVLPKTPSVLKESTHRTLQRVINKDNKVYADSDIRVRIKYYFCNYIWRRSTDEFPKPWVYDGENIQDIIKLSDLLFDPTKIICITAPYKYLRLCEDAKNCGTGDLKSIGYDMGDVDKNLYITNIINNYKGNLNIFPIESVWEGTWKEHIEKFINRELTTHQIQVCKLLIGRWLYVTPQSIKDEFNI